jgi:hypothetical protein
MDFPGFVSLLIQGSSALNMRCVAQADKVREPNTQKTAG